MVRTQIKYVYKLVLNLWKKSIDVLISDVVRLLSGIVFLYTSVRLRECYYIYIYLSTVYLQHSILK